MRLHPRVVGLGLFLAACGSRGEDSKKDGGFANGMLGGLRVYDKSSGTSWKPDAKGALVLQVFPASQGACLPEIDKLEATANGKAMTVEAKGGSSTKVNLAHGKTVDKGCHPIDVWIDKSDIPAKEDGTVMFELSDGSTKLEIGWARLFEARKPVLDSKTLKIGEPAKGKWNVDEDELVASKHFAVCLRPTGAEAESCKLGPDDCAVAKLDERTVTFAVPDSWGCAKQGALFIRGLTGKSKAQKCDERLKQCSAEIAPSEVEVEISK